MKEHDDVELIVEKERYAKEGAHKGMLGTIVCPESNGGTWLVEFQDIPTGVDENGLFDDGIVAIKEEDLRVIKESD